MRPRLQSGRVVRAIGRLVVLVAVGFGVGLLFGVVTEEPELLARHLRGESESAGLPPVAAAHSFQAPSLSMAPVGNSQSTGIPVARTNSAPEFAMRATGASQRWSIQVGAFSEQAAATRLAQGLRGRYPVEVLPASGKSGRWRVRVQPIRSEGRAREMAEQLKQEDRLPTWVTPMEGRLIHD